MPNTGADCGAEAITATPLWTGSGRLTAPINASDHVVGPPDALVTLVEYGDYQCPYSAAAYPVVQDLLSQRHDSVRFVYRHFPLTNPHPYAEVAAEVAEASAGERRFWPVHDWLFEHQGLIEPRYLSTGLDELGLDGEKIMNEVFRHRYAAKVQSDFVAGVHGGVDGTPTFFINGTRHHGGYSYPELMYAVDEAAAPAASTARA